MVCGSRFLFCAVRVAAFCGVGSSMVVVMMAYISMVLFLILIAAILADAGVLW